jgi:hypothetical protein
MHMGVKQDLMGLQRIGTQLKGPAVRQLDAGHLQLGALTAQHRKIFAPVKLERLAKLEDKRHNEPDWVYRRA